MAASKHKAARKAAERGKAVCAGCDDTAELAPFAIHPVQSTEDGKTWRYIHTAAGDDSPESCAWVCSPECESAVRMP